MHVSSMRSKINMRRPAPARTRTARWKPGTTRPGMCSSLKSITVCFIQLYFTHAHDKISYTSFLRAELPKVARHKCMLQDEDDFSPGKNSYSCIAQGKARSPLYIGHALFFSFLVFIV